MTIFALRRMKNIGMVSEKLYWNTSRSFSKSHQYSYFQIKALAGLNQERERELSSAFDKPSVNLCGKNQTYLCQTVCISTQSKPQTSVLQKRNLPKKKSRLSYSCEIKRCSLPWSGSWGRHVEANALRDDRKDNCKQDYASEANCEFKKFITHSFVAHFAI